MSLLIGNLADVQMHSSVLFTSLYFSSWCYCRQFPVVFDSVGQLK